jgi:hypothetical protein
MPKIASLGTCALCGATFSKQAMTRHLKGCLAAAAAPPRAKPQTTFHLLVEGAGRPMYWLHLDLPASATLTTLDGFLRDVWVECCGHLSAFSIDGVSYEMDTGGVDGMWLDLFGSAQPTKSMNVSASAVLRPGLKFGYEYDFGTTTALTLKVIAEQERVRKGKAVQILARNLPPLIPCVECGEPATLVCSYCSDDESGWVCETHAVEHPCGEEGFLPVVNSPRVGMCGYTG